MGFHGGEVETSLMLHIRPDLVRRQELDNFQGLPSEMAKKNRWLGPEKPVGFGWMSQDLHPHGVIGNAQRADATRGASLLAHLCACFAALIDEVAATPLSVLRETTHASSAPSSDR